MIKSDPSGKFPVAKSALVTTVMGILFDKIDNLTSTSSDPKLNITSRDTMSTFGDSGMSVGTEMSSNDKKG